MTWESIPLGEVGTWYGGGTPAKSNAAFWSDGSIPWLSPKDMGPEVLGDTQDHITPDAVAGSAARLVPAPSVAVVTRSGILERRLPVALVPFATAMNQDMKAVVPREGIDPRWVAWGLRAFERDLLRVTRKAGTTVASIEFPRLQRFELPVPSLDEQRRILEILEDHVSRLDAAEHGLRLADARTRRLRESALQEALEVARAHPSTRINTIGDLATVTTGMTPLKANKVFYDGGSIPWITSGDLAAGVVASASQFVTEQALLETSLKLVKAGAILLAMYGEGKTRGTAALLEIDATTNQACAAIHLHEPGLRTWVKVVLDSNYRAMRRMAAGGVQPNLNLSLVRSIEVPVPPPEVREAALQRLRELDDHGSRLRRSVGEALGRCATLRRAILAAAISGNLSVAVRSAA